MDPAPPPAYIEGMTTLGTRLFTHFRGRLIGQDPDGNRYYTEKRVRPGLRTRRWVIYAGLPEASKVPAEWHSWLHYTTEDPIPLTARPVWGKPHLPNMTGTPDGYRPPGHDYRGGARPRTVGDYEAWTPGS